MPFQTSCGVRSATGEHPMWEPLYGTCSIFRMFTEASSAVWFERRFAGIVRPVGRRFLHPAADSTNKLPQNHPQSPSRTFQGCGFSRTWATSAPRANECTIASPCMPSGRSPDTATCSTWITRETVRLWKWIFAARCGNPAGPETSRIERPSTAPGFSDVGEANSRRLRQVGSVFQNPRTFAVECFRSLHPVWPFTRRAEGHRREGTKARAHRKPLSPRLPASAFV